MRRGEAGAGMGNIIENRLIQPRREGQAGAGASRGLLQEWQRFDQLETTPHDVPEVAGDPWRRREAVWGGRLPRSPAGSQQRAAAARHKGLGGEGGLSKEPPNIPDPHPVSLNWDRGSKTEVRSQTTAPWVPARTPDPKRQHPVSATQTQGPRAGPQTPNYSTPYP